MREALAEQLLAAVARLMDVLPNDGVGAIVLPNLEWWQALVSILGILGLSPAPWLIGLAMGRIQFSGPARKDFERQNAERSEAHQRELKALERQHAALLAAEQRRYADLEASNRANAEAAERERRRAEAATDAVMEMTEVVRANAHVMASVGEAAQIAATEAPDG